MIEKIILSNLIHNNEYMRKVLPYLKKEYFSGDGEKIIFNIIIAYINKYNILPSKDSLKVDLDDIENLTEVSYKKSIDVLNKIELIDKNDIAHTIYITEKWCKERALYIALVEAIRIADKNSGLAKGAITNILSDALSVSFDSHIGHDFIEDFSARYDYYHTDEVKIPFDIDYMNLITGGGFPNKTISVILGGTHAGKSLVMCHFASNNLLKGKNVLYITLEMSEERIAERVDANLLDINLHSINELDKEEFQNKIEILKNKNVGKLIIKEYPTASAGANNFRYLLQELKLKKNFIPDIVYIDYINICKSSRVKDGTTIGSYFYVKMITEELRGLAIEFNIPIVSATQTTRGGSKSSDLDMTDVSESFAIAMTSDLMIAIISTEELVKQNLLMFKQLKNRFRSVNKYSKFVVGVDRDKFRLFNASNMDQSDILGTEPLPSNNVVNDGNSKINFRGFT